VTIDPKLYKKYTGRLPGEATTRMGEALAQSSARKSAAKAGAERSFSERYLLWRFPGAVLVNRWALSVVGAIILLVAILGLMWTPADWQRLWWRFTGGPPQRQTPATPQDP
jgi:hypothetical protein